MSSQATNQTIDFAAATEAPHTASAPASLDDINLIEQILLEFRAADPATREQALEFLRSNVPKRSPAMAIGSATSEAIGTR